ncbi:hypothetical protein EVAR_41376_1 [Eumeta japonica]|uniref:Uncharacterized protein n=1 Tax=Eumeta variegata TaxID=151549 RepID=A0A4C1WZC0_EUMVA|nr:hypothetical protein EVAR_41376_1 [Eumeta japonica]
MVSSLSLTGRPERGSSLTSKLPDRKRLNQFCATLTDTALEKPIRDIGVSRRDSDGLGDTRASALSASGLADVNRPRNPARLPGGRAKRLDNVS